MLSRIPPSTRTMSSRSTGTKAPGTAMLARRASARLPRSSTTRLPERTSAATARNGMARSSNVLAVTAFMVSVSSRKPRSCPAMRPRAEATAPFLIPSSTLANRPCPSRWRSDTSRRGGWSSNSASQSVAASSRSMACGDQPQAYRPPTMAPMLVPTMKSIGMRSSSSTSSTPTCAMPLAPPPESTSAIRGRARPGACCAPPSWAVRRGAASAPSSRARIGSRRRRAFISLYPTGGRCVASNGSFPLTADRASR